MVANSASVPGTFLKQPTGDAFSVSSAQERLERLQEQEHPLCLFCGKKNPIGFQLDFKVVDRGSVKATFPCGRLFQSYAATLHGGVTSALLDAAMTNCLFSEGIVALTGELTVRYLNPVLLNQEAEVSARLAQPTSPLFRLCAELSQQGRIVAKASAKFVDRSWSATGSGNAISTTTVATVSLR